MLAEPTLFRKNNANRMSIDQHKSYPALLIFLAFILITSLLIWGVAVRDRYMAVSQKWHEYTDRESNAYSALSDVHRYIGYGGFIHDFKNFVLRRDDKYLKKIDSDITNLFAALDRLDGLLSFPEDRMALAKLRLTFEEYRSKFQLAKPLVASGKDPISIDKVVKVDDNPALEARAILLRNIMKRNMVARKASEEALTSANFLLYMGVLFFIPTFGLALLTTNFIQRTVQASHSARTAKEQADLLLESTPDPMLVVDSDGCIQRANSMAVQYFGYAKPDLIGMKVESLIPEKYRLGHVKLRSKQTGISDSRPMGRGQALKTVLASGEERDVAIGLSHFKVGTESVTTVVVRDITEQLLAEEELRLAASVFQSSSEGVLITDAKGTILSVNPAFTCLTGYTELEAVGQTPRLLRSEHHDAEFYNSMWESLLQKGQWQGEIWNRKKGGEVYLEWLTINRVDDNTGRPVRYAAVFHDITELRRDDEHIRHLAFHDPLTELPNRLLLQERLQHAISLAHREGNKLGVMFIDLDKFKAVNDSLGHEIGDVLLQSVSGRINECIRASDTLARIGGDEFVVLLEGKVDEDVCSKLAAKIIDVASEPIDLRGHTVQIGASVGISIYPEDGESSQELMKNADAAMYSAKSGGRNAFRRFISIK